MAAGELAQAWAHVEGLRLDGGALVLKVEKVARLGDLWSVSGGDPSAGAARQGIGGRVHGNANGRSF